MAGLYYEEYEPGSIIEHALTRTITEMDNILFSTLTLNSQPLHLDEEFAKKSVHGQRLVNSIFTLGLVNGITVIETTFGKTLGNLAFEGIEFPAPVFHGDTIHAKTEVIDKRESKSRPGTGIVRLRHIGYNQRDEVVCTCQRLGLMQKRPQAGTAA